MAAGNTLSSIDASLKEAYPIGTFEKQFSEQKELYKRIEKMSTSDFQVINMGGRRSVIPVLKGRVMGRGWRAENTALPESRSLQPDNLYVSNKNIYVRGYITNQVIKMAEKNWEAFMPELELLTEGMHESVQKKFNFSMYRSASGAITTVNGAVNASTSIVLTSLKGIELDMALDVWTTETGGTQEADSVIVTDITESTKTITVDTAVTLTSGSYVFEAGDQNNAMDGLLGNLATTGTVHGVLKTGAGKSWWAGNVISSSVGTITDAALRNIKTAAEKADPTNMNRFWLTTFEVRDQIWDKLLRADRRYNDATIAGGVKTFTYHDYPVVAENDCPAGYIFLIDAGKVKLLRVDDFEYIMNAGSIQHPVSGYDSVEIALRSYCNMLVTYAKAVPYSYGVTES